MTDERRAVIDPTGTYRYRLSRVWDPSLGTVTWIMLNPSTADAELDDPTIRRCRGFATAWGYGGLDVVNLYALRTTRPVHLWEHSNPIGPDNARHVAAAVDAASIVVAAWGVNGARYDFGDTMAETVAARVGKLYCLGVTNGGHPRHPLYVRADTRPVLFERAGS